MHFQKVCVLGSSFFLFLMFLSLPVFSLEFNGTIKDTNGNFLNNTLINITIRNTQFTIISYNATRSNASGWFNITLDDTAGLFFQPVIQHTNTSTNAITLVGQSIPAFPGQVLQIVSGITFFLKPAGTLNITAINSTGHRINFRYQIKDQKLGYALAENLANPTGISNIVVPVPQERNYSIMIYPDQSMPVSYDWNNFTAVTSYTFANAISSYNTTTKTLNKQFNTTLSLVRVSGYINYSTIQGWNEFTVVPYLVEPGNIVHATYGDMPYNLSAFSPSPNMTDTHNITSGFYNISLPATAETSQILLFATARNGSIYFGAYRNVSLSYVALPSGGEVTSFNFTHLTGLLGTITNISMDTVSGSQFNVSTAKQTFNLRNVSNGTISNIAAHIEATIDYSSKGAIKFTWMEDIQQGSTVAFSLPIPNSTAVEEFNIFVSGGDGNDYAPFRASRTISQIQTNNNFSLKGFAPGDIDQQVAASQISINLYHSNITCDVPTPPDGCIIGGSRNVDPTSTDRFNPMQAILGGGKLSFRMGTGNIFVHYVNVDLLASGPPDALFDDSATEKTSGSFDAALRFGSQGPTIFDYVLISFPYSITAGSGLDDTQPVNLTIPVFYDENWNVIWNTSRNSTSATAFANNYTHYAPQAGAWETLMNGTLCVTNSSSQWFNITNPCYIDQSNNAIWIRLPHFSGTGPSLSGTLLPATTTTATPTTSTSSGGSKTSSPVAASSTFAELTPYQTNILTYDAQTLGVETITFSVTQPVSQARFTLTEYLQTPPGTAPLPTVYKYFEIITPNIPSNILTSPQITFLVPQEWLTQNQATPEQITLYRHTNAWTALPTTYLGQTGTFHRYTADTPGFSYFAIGLTNTIIQPSPQPMEPSQEQQPSLALSSPKLSIKLVLFILGILLLLILFFFTKRRSQKQKR